MLVFHSHSIDQPEQEQTLTTIGWRPHISTLLFIAIGGIWLHADPMRVAAGMQRPGKRLSSLQPPLISINRLCI